MQLLELHSNVLQDRQPAEQVDPGASRSEPKRDRAIAALIRLDLSPAPGGPQIAACNRIGGVYVCRIN